MLSGLELFGELLVVLARFRGKRLELFGVDLNIVQRVESLDQPEGHPAVDRDLRVARGREHADPERTVDRAGDETRVDPGQEPTLQRRGELAPKMSIGVIPEAT